MREAPKLNPLQVGCPQLALPTALQQTYASETRRKLPARHAHGTQPGSSLAGTMYGLLLAALSSRFVSPHPSPQILGQLFDTRPNWIATDALGGCPFAHSSTGTLYIADPPTVEQWMPQEWQLGTVTNWPDTIGERPARAQLVAVFV